MAVYVDELFTAVPRTAEARQHGTRWCHLSADSEEELEGMARRLGLRPAWRQGGTAWDPARSHYDLVPTKRALAVEYGAVELDADAVRERAAGHAGTVQRRRFQAVAGAAEPWDRLRDSREDFRERVLQRFASALDADLDRIERGEGDEHGG